MLSSQHLRLYSSHHKKKRWENFWLASSEAKSLARQLWCTTRTLRRPMVWNILTHTQTQSLTYSPHTVSPKNIHFNKSNGRIYRQRSQMVLIKVHTDISLCTLQNCVLRFWLGQKVWYTSKCWSHNVVYRSIHFAKISRSNYVYMFACPSVYCNLTSRTLRKNF